MVQLSYTPTEALTESERGVTKNLQSECLVGVSRELLEQCFYAKSFGYVFALEDGLRVGHTALFLRETVFLGRKMLFGGLGDVCVTSSARRRGIATQMVKRSCEILTERGCDVAALTANIKDHPHGVYYRIGFRAMGRKISFEDSSGGVRYEDSEMFFPLRSKELYELVMTSGETLHMGKGLW